MLRFVLLCVCVGLSVQAAVEQKAGQAVSKKNDWDDWTKPAFCRENDCPVYDVLEVGEGYELRSYKSGVWVSTQYEAIDYDQIEASASFQRLFQYIEGENESGEKVEMTSPVLDRILPGSGPNCKSTFRRSFYMEWTRQTSAPVPTRSDVELETMPARNVYVRSFPGFATIDQALSEVIALGAAIGDESKFFTGFWFQAVYDSPFRPFGRHNEVWLQATS